MHSLSETLESQCDDEWGSMNLSADQLPLYKKKKLLAEQPQQMFLLQRVNEVESELTVQNVNYVLL